MAQVEMVSGSNPFSAIAGLRGKTVLVHGRAHEADGPMREVARQLREVGALPKFAVIWNARQANVREGKTRVTYPITREFKEPGKAEYSVLVLPDAPDPDLLAHLLHWSMWYSDPLPTIVVIPSSDLRIFEFTKAVARSIGLIECRVLLGKETKDGILDLESFSHPFVGTPKLVKECTARELVERTRILEDAVTKETGSGVHVRDILPVNWSTRRDIPDLFPYTYDLPLVLRLDAPPIPVREPVATRYGPEDTIDCQLWFDSEVQFDCRRIGGMLKQELRKDFLFPTLYVTTAEGVTTYLQSKDGPEMGIAMGFAWTAGRAEAPSELSSAAGRITEWLEGLPSFRFHLRGPFDVVSSERKCVLAEAIKAMGRHDIEVTVKPRDRRGVFDGRMVWDLMHAMGFLWGEAEAYNWHHPKKRNQVLVFADGGDGSFDHTVPMDIHGGRRDYDSMRFSMTGMRTHAAPQVARQLVRAAEFFSGNLGGVIDGICIDDKKVAGFGGMFADLDRMVADLRDLGTEPGASPVMMLV